MMTSIKSHMLRTGAVVATAAALVLPAVEARAQDFYIGTIQAYGFNFCPRGTMQAAGQLLPIAQYQALFSLLGNQYGGDARTNFGLPDLRGRSMVGYGTQPGLDPISMGQKVGSSSFILTAQQMPQHNHMIAVTSSVGNEKGPANDILGASSTDMTKRDVYTYSNAPANSYLRTDAVTSAGNSAPVNHRSPVQGVNFCIVTDGLYPSRS